MSILVYCLKYPESCGCDPEITLNKDKAMSWLEDYKNTNGCQVLEYLVLNDQISDLWQKCWYYYEGKLHSIIAKDYLD